MQKFRLALYISAISLIFSCKKVDVNDATEDITSIQPTALNGARVGTSDCVPSTVDITKISTQNQVPDAPISPATGGTTEQNAQTNYERIQWCLYTYGKALLTSGEFVINNVLIMDNAQLISANGDWPVVKATSDYSNSMIKLNHNCRVAFLTLNADKFLRDSNNNASVIEIGGDNNQVDNNVIMGGSVPLYNTDPYPIVGVYIMCGDNNTVWNNKISNNHSGVIVTRNFKVSYVPSNNTITENEVFGNRSDGITLVSYGKVLNNKIYNNGWDCQNGGAGSPIPGAGIYSQENLEGALIEGNTIYDNTGHNIDLTSIQHFIIKNNIVYNPGNTDIPGITNTIVAGGAMSVCIVDASYCVIENNDIRNEDRSCNKVGGGGWWDKDINRFFSKNAYNDRYSDLPFGDNSIIAFGLIESRCNRIDDSGHVVLINQVKQNTIRNNIFIASPNGIGYFASRNTGFEADSSWSASSTNYYTLNNPNGSNVGSVRCGGNWYAANGIDANADDNQHQPPSSSWSGNLIGREWFDGTCAPGAVSYWDFNEFCIN